jgi:hypothetical protein
MRRPPRTGEAGGINLALAVVRGFDQPKNPTKWPEIFDLVDPLDLVCEFLVRWLSAATPPVQGRARKFFDPGRGRR